MQEKNAGRGESGENREGWGAGCSVTRREVGAISKAKADEDGRGRKTEQDASGNERNTRVRESRSDEGGTKGGWVVRGTGKGRRKRDKGRVREVCDKPKKTEEESRMTRGLRGKCFFVAISKNEGWENNRGWKRMVGSVTKRKTAVTVWRNAEKDRRERQNRAGWVREEKAGAVTGKTRR